MKLLCTGDWHIREKRPRSRTDESYVDTIFEKLDFIFRMSREYNARILQAGDVVDSVDCSFKLLGRLYTTLSNRSGGDVYHCLGQHDLYYHSLANYEKSPVFFLNEAIADFQLLLNDNAEYLGKNASVYSASFGESIPNIPREGDFNILVTHRMVIDSKLWHDQTDYEYGPNLLKENKFDLIVCGDNHQQFVHRLKDGRTLINPGSLMRSSTSQIDHEPAIYIFDTDTRDYERIPIPVKPAEKVFRIDQIEKEKEMSDEMDKFISELKGMKFQTTDYPKSINDFCEENEIEKKVKKRIQGYFKWVSKS